MSNNELQAAINALIVAVTDTDHEYLHNILKDFLAMQKARASAIYTHDKSDEILD